MSNVERSGVNVQVALAANARRMPREAQQHAAGHAMAINPGLSPGASSQPELNAGGLRGALKSSVRPFAKAIYRIVKPVLRPLAFRVRAYLQRPLLELSQKTLQLADAKHEAVLLELRSLRLEIARTGQQQKAQMDAVQFELLQEIEAVRDSLDPSFAGADALKARLDTIEQYSYVSARRAAVPGAPGEVLVRTAVGYVLCPAFDYPLLATLVDAGELEPGTRQLIQRLLRPGETFVDAGANVGMHTLAAARAIGGKGRVIAFEPHPGTHALVQKSVILNGFADVVELHQAAVSDRNGRLPLFLGVTSGHHSLYPLESAPSQEANAVEVPLLKIDDVVAGRIPVDLIKIDVEGAELEALKGAASTVERNADIALIVELGSSHLKRTGHTIAQWLADFERLGLEYRAVDPSTGALVERTLAELEAAESTNLLFARPASKAWRRARGEA